RLGAAHPAQRRVPPRPRAAAAALPSARGLSPAAQRALSRFRSLGALCLRAAGELLPADAERPGAGAGPVAPWSDGVTRAPGRIAAGVGARSAGGAFGARSPALARARTGRGDGTAWLDLGPGRAWRAAGVRWSRGAWGRRLGGSAGME